MAYRFVKHLVIGSLLAVGITTASFAAAPPSNKPDAAETARAAFEEGRVSQDLPTIEVARTLLEAGVPLSNLAADAGLAASRSDARRLAQGGGLRLNDTAETDGQRLVTLADCDAGGLIKLAAGKKKIVLVRPV